MPPKAAKIFFENRSAAFADNSSEVDTVFLALMG